MSVRMIRESSPTQDSITLVIENKNGLFNEMYDLSGMDWDTRQKKISQILRHFRNLRVAG